MWLFYLRILIPLADHITWIFNLIPVLTSSICNWDADQDLEDLVPSRPEGKSSGTVLPYVGVACLGAILFGYHLGYGLL